MLIQSQTGASNTPSCISAIRDAYKSGTKAPTSSARPARTHTAVHLQVCTAIDAKGAMLLYMKSQRRTELKVISWEGPASLAMSMLTLGSKQYLCASALGVTVQEAHAMCPEGNELSETYHKPAHIPGASAGPGPDAVPSPAGTKGTLHAL